jgi:hypothetical protein
MSNVLATLEKKTPHLDSMMPYGYRFEGISVYHVNTKNRMDLDVFSELEETHDHRADVNIGGDNPHRDRIVWEIAHHIEGCFGLPFHAVLTVREEDGYIVIHTPKDCSWWNNRDVGYTRLLRQYFMGLRSLLDLLKS